MFAIIFFSIIVSYKHACALFLSLYSAIFYGRNIYRYNFIFYWFQVPIESLNFLTRVHYSARADENWGEHELDYVLVCQTDVTLDKINEDEVQSVSWLNQNELKRFLKDAKKHNILVTPWFNYISEKMLFKWWDNLDDINRYKDDIIHRAGLQ